MSEERVQAAGRQLVVNAVPLLGNLTGVGQVTAEISKRLSLSTEFSVGFYTPFKTFSELDQIEFPNLKMRAVRKAKKLFRQLPFKDALRNISSRIGAEGPLCDLYWEPNFIPIDAVSARRTVTTVHDMSFHEHPEWHPRDRVGFFARNFFSRIGRSDVVVTVSQFSRDCFLASQTDVSADRVRVIPCGINHDCFRVMDAAEVAAFRQRLGLPESFVLFVGSIEPRKNLQTLLAAYERFSPDRRNAFPLVLVGDTGWRNKEIHQRIKKLGRGVRTVGYVQGAEDLALMYNAATVFVYPSLYEGFGIPPLEAMACGTPVCISSIPVFREVYGAEAAAYADPRCPESLADALIRLLDDAQRRERLIGSGLELARRFSWDRVYEQYARVFKELMNK